MLYMGYSCHYLLQYFLFFLCAVNSKNDPYSPYASIATEKGGEAKATIFFEVVSWLLPILIQDYAYINM
jgi:hypothetical protein